jgi:hypothetical protein
MTIADWLAAARRTINTACWVCGAPQTRTGWVGYGLPFHCPTCDVGWSVKVPKE